MANQNAVATAARPQLVQPGSDQPRTIQKLLTHPDTIAKFKQVAPRHLSPERLLRVMAHAVYKVPKLAECEPLTLLGAMMACASLGLEPNTPLGHAYLIPFEVNKWNPQTRKRELERVDVQLIIGYRGYVDLARRSGSLVSIHADVVYEGDEFSFEYGSNMHLRHVPKGARDNRRSLWAYAHAKLQDGEAFEVLPYDQVLQIRNATQGFKAAIAAKKEADEDQNKRWRLKTYEAAPWVAFEHEMAAKTMIRRIAKMLPMSIEFANAAALDAMSESGRVDFSAFADGAGSAFLDAESAARPEIEGPTDEGDDAAPAEQEQAQQPQEAPAQAERSAPRRTRAAKPDPEGDPRPEPPPAESEHEARAQQEPQKAAAPKPNLF